MKRTEAFRPKVEEGVEKMRFLHAADFHLNITLKSASFKDTAAHERRIRELQGSLERIVHEAEEKKADALLLAGDIFDDPYMPLADMEELFEKLSRAETKVFFLVGNHDTFLQNKAYARFLEKPNIHTFSKERIKHTFAACTIYGINTRDFSEGHLQKIVRDVDASRTNILMLHGDVKNRKDEHYLLDWKKLRDFPFDYIALGHIHKHEFLTPSIAYSGNPEPLDFSETGERGYIEGEIRRKDFSAKFLPFQKRLFHVHPVTITAEDSPEEIAERIRSAFFAETRRNDFFRIELQGERAGMDPLDKDTLLSLLEDDFHYVELKDKTRPALDFEELKKSYKDTIIAHLVEMAEEREDMDEESLRLALGALFQTEEV